MSVNTCALVSLVCLSALVLPDQEISPPSGLGTANKEEGSCRDQKTFVHVYIIPDGDSCNQHLAFLDNDIHIITLTSIYKRNTRRTPQPTCCNHMHRLLSMMFWNQKRLFSCWTLTSSDTIDRNRFVGTPPQERQDLEIQGMRLIHIHLLRRKGSTRKRPKCVMIAQAHPRKLNVIRNICIISLYKRLLTTVMKNASIQKIRPRHWIVQEGSESIRNSENEHQMIKKNVGPLSHPFASFWATGGNSAFPPKKLPPHTRTNTHTQQSPKAMRTARWMVVTASN